ncbi:Ctr copper transporter family-domain-containing protein [Favolaschia claudopus]|uniref:Copper transport protein n=1 Tax=Favolaschia claudopus TaxID=2862362 RepID=A0AAW0C1S6_9AGAR
MDGMMNMTDPSASESSNSSSTGMDNMPTMMMKAYLHFTPGDTLLFNSIVPSSGGAIFGACLILFLISVGDRYLRAVIRGIERNFAQRAHRLTTAYHFAAETPDSKIAASETSTASPTPSNRFILSHELARGVLAGLQTTIHYLLMLVVMTFNAAFIISVILGVVVGETAFGRLHRG